METDQTKLTALNYAALQLTEQSSAFHRESTELLGATESTKSLPEIDEATESIRVLNQTVKILTESVAAMRKRFSL